MGRTRKTTKTTFKLNKNVDSSPLSKKPRVLTFINNKIDTMSIKPVHSKNYRKGNVIREKPINKPNDN